MLWRLLPLGMAALGIGGVAYLVARFHRFGCLRALAERKKPLSWLLAAAPVAMLCCFAFINLTTLGVVLLHLIGIWLLCDGVGLLLRRLTGRRARRYWAGAAALLLTAAYLGGGWWAAHRVCETRYAFTTSKPLGGESLRIVALADCHLGITLDGEDFAALMERVRATEPDAVAIVGDFVDDDTDRVDMLRACEALGGLRSVCGVYFAYGNHDEGYFNYRNFTSAELRAALEANGVTILEDEAALVDGSFYIAGRRDRSMPRADARALTAELDLSKYVVLLDHQPNDYAAEAASGADLVISGHTHGGHIFPAGYIGLLLGANDRVYGTERRGETTFVVTSGASGWAIPFKTGAISEYVVIDIAGPAA